MKHPVKILFLFTIFLFTIQNGMRTHQEAAHRAYVHFENKVFKEILDKNQNSFQAGSAFPDWGYICGYGHEAEEIHWPKMINWIAKYIHDKYGGDPQRWSEDTKKFVSFFFGIESHHIVDKLFHSIDGVNYGFINVNSKQCFNGSYDRAHDNSDTGGDFTYMHSVGLPNWVVDPWFVPTKEISEIYQRFNLTRVTESLIERCTFLQYVVVAGIRFGGEILYANYALRSPFLVQQLNEWPIGGIFDAGQRTLYHWKDLIRILETGRYNENNEINERNKDHMEIDIKIAKKELQIYEQFKDFIMNTLKPKMKKTSTGVYFYLEGDIASLKNKEESKTKSDFPSQGDLSLTGFTLSKNKIDNNRDQLIISSPGYGPLGSPYSGKISFFETNYEMISPERNSWFGKAIAHVDLNLDGFKDLVVGAPLHQAGHNQYYPRGAVYVYFGGRENTYSKAPNVTILGDHNNYNKFSSVGQVLEVGDVNGDGHDDLIIGSPMENELRGLVTIYYAKRTLRIHYRNLVESDAHISVSSDHFNMFAEKLKYISHKPYPILLVGAPSEKFRSSSLVGALYGYELRGREIVKKFKIHGNENFEQFGFNFAYGRPWKDQAPVLAVTSVTATIYSPKFSSHAGAVYLFDIDNLRGNLSISQINKITTFQGDIIFSRLGWELGFYDLNQDGIDDMYLSEPFKDTNVGLNAGIVYVIYGGDKFPRGVVRNVKEVSSKVFEPVRQRGRFGYTILAGKFRNNRTNLVISSPVDSSNYYYGGSIEIKDF